MKASPTVARSAGGHPKGAGISMPCRSASRRPKSGVEVAVAAASTATMRAAVGQKDFMGADILRPDARGAQQRDRVAAEFRDRSGYPDSAVPRTTDTSANVK